MASGDTGGTSGTPTSPIKSMASLEETPPIVVAREVPDEGGSVVTVEPPDRQQPVDEGHFFSTTVLIKITSTQTSQPPSMSSMTNAHVTSSITSQQPMPIQMTMPQPTFFQTPPLGQLVAAQLVFS